MTDETPTRGRMGRIDGLAEQFRELIHRRLRGGLSQNQILREVNEVLAGAGEQPVSKSSLNRYARKMERSAARMREVRQVADMWTARFGEEPGQRVTQMMVDMLEAEVFDAIVRLRDSDEPIDSETLNQLALGMQRLARASEISSKREREIRREMAEEAAREAKRNNFSDKAADALRAHLAGYRGA
ncbi:MAG: DUF3486 family protein [Rhodospirillales bacterium]|nr:DUF3486 family protein [Rhodospirillales bacterium]